MKQGWEVNGFEDCLEKIVYTNKVQRKDFLVIGKYPIISQEQDFINGYWDNSADLFTVKKPIIIFGDHTQVLKYVDFDFVLGADGVKILQPKSIIYPRFFYYFLQSINLGSLGYARHYRLLKEIEVHFPTSLPEQQRIVAILDEAFAAIAQAKANAEQNLKNAKELFESYLQSVFENKGEGWEEKTLGEMIELLVGFAFKSKDYTEVEDDILLLRGDNIMQGYLRLDDVKRWSKLEFETYKKYQLQENDILLAMDRPWVKAGLKIAKISNKNLPALLVQRTACLRTKSNLDNSFLFYLLKSNGFMKYLIDVQTGIGVPHISGKQILDFSFTTPPLKEQQIIIQKLDALSTETKQLEAIYQQKINNLDEFKKSILQKAFAGELNTTALVA